MRHRERQTATLLSVSESVAGTTLSADAASGATTLFVDDVSVFDESGWLMVGTQVVKYTAIDDDAGTVTLATALTAAADTDDPVYRYSKLYGDVETVLSAQVAVLGDRDQADELTVEVADTLDLPTGDRGIDGENCTIESDGDVWTLIHASGRPSKARGLKFETDDFYVITAADVTAGAATILLSHVPVAESVKLWWRTVAQEPTEYTVNATAQTITLPLGSFVAAGDRVWVHYAYRVGLAKVTAPVGFTRVGATLSHGFNWTSVPWPTGTQAGDLFVFAQMARTAAVNTCTDSRATLVASGTLRIDPSIVNTCKVWTGTVSDVSTPFAAAATDLGGAQEDDYGMFVIRPDLPITVDLARIGDSGEQGTGQIPSLPGSGSGAIGVGFSMAGLGGTAGHSWASPWVFNVADQNGAYGRISLVLQTNPVVAATPAITTDPWHGYALGLTEG